MDKTLSSATAKAAQIKGVATKPTVGKPAAASEAASTPALLAKAALRRMAQDRLEPTPANYARAWRDEGGDDVPEPVSAAGRAALMDLANRLLPPGVAREPLVEALASQRWNQLAEALPAEVATPAQQARDWSELIDRLTRQLERSSKGWTPGRKKESLQHVLTSARSDVLRLQQRLRQLVGSWDGEADADAPLGADSLAAGPIAATAATPEAGVRTAGPSAQPESPQPQSPQSSVGSDASESLLKQACEQLESTLQSVLVLDGDSRAAEVGAHLHEVSEGAMASPASEAITALAEACDEARRLLQHRHHLLGQMGGLISELTEGLGDLSEDESWMRGQCDAMRQELADGLSARGVRAVSKLLHDTRLRQQQLRAERTQARDALRELIHHMLQDIGDLGTQTGRFNDNLGRYVEVIGKAESLSDLTSVVREMVDDTRSVHALVAQTTQRLSEEHAKASELSNRVKDLEEELRRLSTEVSTDQLTQVANRRGLIARFSQETARVARQGGSLAVSILDLDNFKRLNDTMGHQTGDEALKFLSRRVGELLRPCDVLARYGGEEFVVLLPDTEIEESQRVLTRVQRQLSAELFMHEDKQTFITFSAGVTLYRGGEETLEAALQRADEALYEAKRSGKNRTCIA